MSISSRTHPSISVVIPVYNRGHLLRSCVDSLLCQTVPLQDIVVCDDGSTDNTADVICSYGTKVRSVKQANAGCATARNHACALCNSDYIAFVDSDDTWYPHTHEILINAIEEKLSPPVLALSRVNFRGKRLEATEEDETKTVVTVDHATAVASGKVFGTCVLVLKKEIFDRSGGFIEKNVNGTDAIFNLQIADVGPVTELISPPMVAYRLHEDNVVNNFPKTWDGQKIMLSMEASGQFPGGNGLKRHRQNFILRQTRSLSVQMLKAKLPRLAIEVYLKTFWLNLRHVRLKYLLCFAPLALYLCGPQLLTRNNGG